MGWTRKGGFVKGCATGSTLVESLIKSLKSKTTFLFAVSFTNTVGNVPKGTFVNYVICLRGVGVKKISLG